MPETPEEFMQYFRANYPDPDTIIHSPDWHAPKIYRAAVHASGLQTEIAALKQQAEKAKGRASLDEENERLSEINSTLVDEVVALKQQAEQDRARWEVEHDSNSAITKAHGSLHARLMESEAVLKRIYADTSDDMSEQRIETYFKADGRSITEEAVGVYGRLASATALLRDALIDLQGCPTDTANRIDAFLRDGEKGTGLK